MANEIGPYIGEGYVKNKGPVKVYGTPNSKMLDCMTRRYEWIRVARTRVRFTKQKGQS